MGDLTSDLASCRAPSSLGGVSVPCVFLFCPRQCSRSCAGGLQRRAVVCQDEDGHSASYCDVASKPPESNHCGSGPCPQWNFGDWGEVSRAFPPCHLWMTKASCFLLWDHLISLSCVETDFWKSFCKKHSGVPRKHSRESVQGVIQQNRMCRPICVYATTVFQKMNIQSFKLLNKLDWYRNRKPSWCLCHALFYCMPLIWLIPLNQIVVNY